MIDGRLKIYNDPISTPRNGATCVASSGGDAQELCLTLARDTFWSSINSDDDETETLTITFSEPRRIDSIWLVKHNFKNYKITYGSGSNFYLNDKLINSGTYATGINITNNELTTAYFEVEEVLTSRINITIYKTFPANKEKKLTSFVAALMMGEFSNASKAIIDPTIRANNLKDKTLTNKVSVVRGVDSYTAKVTINNTDNQNDQWLYEWLFGCDEPILFWPCGGAYGDKFAVRARGFNLEDIYRVNVTSDYDVRWNSNVYSSGISGVFAVEEAI